MTRSDRLLDHRTAAASKPPPACSHRRDHAEPLPASAGPPGTESDLARHHLHRFFEELLKRAEE